MVKAAYLDGIRFSAPQVVSPPSEQATDLAAAGGSSGDMITWIRADAPAFVTGAVFAALSDSRTGAFGAAQQVAADENASIAVPAFDAAGGRWLIAWASNPEGQATQPRLVRSCDTLSAGRLLQPREATPATVR